MDARWVVSLPPAPPSVAEWEDLLVRMEIMVRALRVSLEPRAGHPVAVGESLRALVDREALVGEWLQAASSAGSARPVGVPEPVGGEREREDPRWLAERFASLRARNFAMLQRRGLEVWGWTATLPGGERPTAYQMVTALVRLDADALAALRLGTQPGAALC